MTANQPATVTVWDFIEDEKRALVRAGETGRVTKDKALPLIVRRLRHKGLISEKGGLTPKGRRVLAAVREQE